MAIDGLRVNNLCGSGQYSGFYMNDAAIQELSYATGSESAEIQSSGIRVNQVPKDGGNRFSGSVLPVSTRAAACRATTARSDEGDSGERAPAHRHRRHGIRLAGQSGVRRPDHEGQGLVLSSPTSIRTAKVYVPSAKFPDGSQAYRNLHG